MMRDPQSSDTYVQKLHALLPAELTAAYVALRGLAGDNPELNHWVFYFSLLLCVLFFIFMPKIINLTHYWHRLIYCATFMVWIISLDNVKWAEALNITNNMGVFLFCTSATAVIWSFSVPYISDFKIK